MSKEIEADGYITRFEDVTPIKHTCTSCGAYRFDIQKRRYVCTKGHSIGGTDWRQKYAVCDEWESEEC